MAKNNISIRGTICGAEYDDSCFDSWIEKGCITPSSRICSAVDAVPSRGAVDLYISSGGGDIFAGSEMIVAMRSAIARGVKFNVKIGSICASMAAGIVAALRASGQAVEVSPNSAVMFHGCYTTTTGGAQAHADEAKELQNFNNTVITDLKKCGVDGCESWFDEGRQYWLDAAEMVSCGLADSITDTEAPAVDDIKATAARFAAFAKLATLPVAFKEEKQMDEIKDEVAAPVVDEVKPLEVEAPIVEEVKAEEPASPVAVVEAPAVMDVEAEFTKRLSAAMKSRDAEINDLKNQMQLKGEELAKAEAEVTRLADELKKRDEEFAVVRDQLQHAEMQRKNLACGALVMDECEEKHAVDHRAVMASLPCNERAAYFEAHKSEF